MRKSKLVLLLLLTFCLIFLAACDNETEMDSLNRDFFIIESTETALAMPEVNRDWRLLGTHFLDGEAIQIWGQSVKNEQLQAFWDVYVYHEDGSSEFLFGGVPSKYRSGWYQDDEGSFFVLLGDTLIKLDREGKEVYSCIHEGRTFTALYQDKRGKWMVLGETEGGTLIASELDRETGDITDTGSFLLEEGIQYVTGQEDGVYLMDMQGVWKLDMGEGTKELILSFVENHYGLEIYPTNFRVTEEGEVEILLSGRKVTLERVNMADTRKVVTLRSVLDMPNVEEAIINFNKGNDTYYVGWEKMEEKESVGTYKEKVGIEIATGGGPDLMFVGGAIMPNNIMDYMGKGVFERLNPYMEQSGINEENYFPLTFNGLMDGEDVYGITIMANSGGNWISAEVLGSTETPTVEELIDALLAYEEKAVLIKNSDASSLLTYFLMASDSIHGAVDWEAGTCDFENELFQKILQVCRRYEDDRSNDYPVLAGSMADGYYDYVLLEERLAQGQVPIWYFFDEGCCPGGRILYTMAINSNSPCKDGAWAFIEYLLTGEIQSTYDDALFPVNRSGFEEIIRKEMEEGSMLYYVDGGNTYHWTFKGGLDGYENSVDAMLDYENYRATHDITEEKAEEIAQMLERTKTFPVRTQAILNIISQEADAYFMGAKDLDEVCKLIQNRVQLYLDEQG